MTAYPPSGVKRTVPAHERNSAISDPLLAIHFLGGFEMRPPEIETDLLPVGAGADRHVVGDLTALINDVHAVQERGLWAEGTVRTTTGEVAGMISAGEIAVARMDGRIVGCVRVRRIGGTGEFGMLAAAADHRGVGVGRELVAFAEELGRRDGLTEMEVELLVPWAWSHPSKDFLFDWYTRRGYREVGYREIAAGTPGASRPHPAPLLATPCDVLILRKDLRKHRDLRGRQDPGGRRDPGRACA
ncbi:GNAT family N-acetyltransferase [Streptomyces sp. NBC_01317]|uniref:GNAT family N-acetyltransferase n=1 Tax=Streptomyces sp. NBC_01317 TaxID=2903822 RepID=UPI002E0E0150|nr:GNAT family N-acetyltransferase [Streptomyces sp. NBC_01317]